MSSIHSILAAAVFAVASISAGFAQKAPAPPDTHGGERPGLAGRSAPGRGEGEAPALDSLVAILLGKNPGLRSARHRAASAEAAVGRYQALDPPQVGVNFFSTPLSSFPNPLEAQREVRFSVSQHFPFPGKLAAKSRAQRSWARMAESRAESEGDEAVRYLKTAYYELYAIQRQLDINEENRALMRRFIEITRARYEVGTGSMPDILGAQTELAQLDGRREILSQREKAVQAEINALLDWPVHRPLGKIADPDGIRLNLEVDALTRLALESRPALKAVDAAVSASRAEADAARREFYPDFMVEGMYMNMREDDNWGVMLGMSVPIAPWSAGRTRSELERRREQTRAAQAELHDTRNQVGVQVHHAALKIKANREVVDILASTTLPQAEQTLQSVIAAYQSGNAEFVRLLEAYRSRFSAREEYYLARMRLMQSRADLELAVGMSEEKIQEALARSDVIKGENE